MKISKNEKPYVILGGFQVPLSGAIVLNAYVSGNTIYQTLYQNGVPFQVPVGRTLKILSIAGSAVCEVTMGHGDAAVGSTVAPAGDVAISIGSTTYKGCSIAAVHSNTALISATIPAGKYPYVKVTTATSCHYSFLCYLE